MLNDRGPGSGDPRLIGKGGVWYAKLLLLLSALPFLVAGALACHFSGSVLHFNCSFKLLVVASTLILCICYGLLARFGNAVNDEGAPILPGTEGEDCSKFYCGRKLPIPGTDGTCGPNNGPQCSSCRKFQQQWAVKPWFWYLMFLHPVMDLAKWVAPSVSLTIIFALWAAPERALYCGPEDWSPMIPLIGNLYLPKLGSAQDEAVRDDLLRLSDINPILPLPRLLFPAMNKPLPVIQRVPRTLFFMSDMAFLTGSTCFILEVVRLVMKTLTPPKPMPTNLPYAEPLLGGNPALSHRNSLDGVGRLTLLEKGFLASFGVWYIGYQVVMYLVMDYGVSRGLMNLTTGIAWELWMPFICYVLVTALVTGTIRYLHSSRHGAHEHPTPVVMMQMMPWLGNELHVMKDHIATALCFAAAHCCTGALRSVGLLLGYLSFIATVCPVVALLQDPKSFKALRSSHWPILEGAFARSQRGTAAEKRWRKVLGIVVDATTKDKYVRAVTGEVPHALLHIVFAFFFGGGMFIVSAIILSAVKILCIPVGRTYLRSLIPYQGCTELALQRFLANAGGLLKWQADPISFAYKFDWPEVLEMLREMYPDLDQVYKDEAAGQYPETQRLEMPDVRDLLPYLKKTLKPMFLSLVAPVKSLRSKKKETGTKDTFPNYEDGSDDSESQEAAENALFDGQPPEVPEVEGDEEECGEGDSDEENVKVALDRRSSLDEDEDCEQDGDENCDKDGDEDGDEDGEEDDDDEEDEAQNSSDSGGDPDKEKSEDNAEAQNSSDSSGDSDEEESEHDSAEDLFFGAMSRPYGVDEEEIQAQEAEEERKAEVWHKVRGILQNIRRKNVTMYMAFLQVLTERLGWIDEEEATALLRDIHSGKSKAEALQYVKPICSMGSQCPGNWNEIFGHEKPDVSEDTLNEMKKVVQDLNGETTQSKSSQQKETQEKDLFFAPRQWEGISDDQDVYRAVEARELEIIKGTLSVTLGVPLIIALAALV